MRLRVADRILVAVAGLLLLAIAAGIVAQLFFQADLVGLAVRVFTSESPRARAALIGLAVFFVLLGIYCVFVLFRHRKWKDKFILQKTEGGELAISVKAMENMVEKCLNQHPELKVQNLYLENKKDGLLIRMRSTVCGGISIPLTVESLQKQIRQYVTACSGVEVKGIRVEIESSGEDAPDAPFAIAAPAAKPLLQEGKAEQTPVHYQEEAPRAPEKAPAANSAPAAVSTPPAAPPPAEEPDDRPLHQRLFSNRPEPCIVPEPQADEREIDQEEPSWSAEPAAEEPDMMDGTEHVLSDGVPEADSADPEAGADPEAETVIRSEDTESDADTAPEEAAEASAGPEEAPETEPEAPAETETETDEPRDADPAFLESLRAFDDAVTGHQKEDEAK